MLTLAEQEKLACDTIDKYREDLVDLAKYLHANPELGQQEFKAVEKITKFFEQKKWKITKPLSKRKELETSFKADNIPEFADDTNVNHSNSIKEMTSVKNLFHMAFLGEYDALPGLGHGCGHNLIATMSAGAALGFAAASEGMATTTFLGCPAEETIGGKVFMAEEGLFKLYDGALIIHPGGLNEIGGTSLATHPLEVIFHGRSAHVASLTDPGINALAAASDLFLAVLKLKMAYPAEKGVVIGGIYTEAGEAPNVIPARATLHFTVRAKKVQFLEEVLLPKVRELANEIADHYGATVEMRHYEPLFKDMQQDPLLLTIIEDVMTEFGEEPKHIPDDEADGSTDVGNVTYEIPTVQPTLNIGSGLEIHTPEFVLAAGSEFGREQAIKGAKIMAVSALRYMYKVHDKT